MPTPTHIRVGQTTIDLLATNDYSEWTDEELVRGQKKNARGSWTGRRPKVVPLGLLQELNLRMASWGRQKLTASVKECVKYLVGVADGTIKPDRDRTHVVEIILNRVWGMAPQKIELHEVEQSEYEKAGVTKAIVIREAIEATSRDSTTAEDDEENPFG